MESLPAYGWSRREELNTPSADYSSAALTLSYTGVETEKSLGIYTNALPLDNKKMSFLT